MPSFLDFLRFGQSRGPFTATSGNAKVRSSRIGDLTRVDRLYGGVMKDGSLKPDAGRNGRGAKVHHGHHVAYKTSAGRSFTVYHRLPGQSYGDAFSFGRLLGLENELRRSAKTAPTRKDWTARVTDARRLRSESLKARAGKSGAARSALSRWRSAASTAESLARTAASANEAALKSGARATELAAKATAAQLEADAKLAAAAAEQTSKAAAKAAEEAARRSAQVAEVSARSAVQAAEAAAKATAVAAEASAKATVAMAEATAKAAAYTAAAAATAVGGLLDP